ncbi:plasmid transfer ATPase TraJ (plasmid) [Xenorhabdus stockiae]|uniref:plasmid transfer ATPase TraJ n=1 Tax=Xenorhabdus stockiae TaxID=351614 RepID=UPI003CF2B952
MTPLTQFDFNRGVNADNLRGFFVHCYRHGVSDIHIQSGSPLTVDHHGRKVLCSQFRLEHSCLIRLTDEIFSSEIKAQVQSGNGVDRPLQLEGDNNGRYQLERGERVRFRCNFAQGTIGHLNTAMAITLRVIPSFIPPLDSLALEEDLQKSLLPLNGLGLVCGETGSGKSTLLASTYQHYGETHPNGKVVTYEDPVEYLLGGPKWILQPQQCQIGRDVKSFADGLRLSLRQAPTVIGIGEIRDLETLQAAMACAQFGQLALSTLHAFSPGHAFSRCYIMAPEDSREQIAFDLLNTLRYIIVQRLIPTIDGKRAAVREYIIFDDEWRRKLTQHHYTQWPEIINTHLRDNNSRIVDRTWQLFINNRIDANVAEKIMGWREFTDKQKAA